MKKISGHSIFFVITVPIIILGSLFLLNQNPKAIPAKTASTQIILAPQGKIIAEAARIIAEQTLGLGERATLKRGAGMLFIFQKEGPQYMWMKDMNFSLDMVWLDKNKKVTHVESGVSPDTYAENPPKIFFSPTNALYVLEIPSGDAKIFGITEGITLAW